MEDKQEKAEKELFALYKKTKDPEIKKEKMLKTMEEV